MNLPDISVKRPIATFAILVIVFVLGIVSIGRASLELLPDIEPPILAVQTVFPGSGPQETKDLVSKPIEESASTVSGLTNLRSISQENISIVILEFDWGTDLDSVRDELDTQLNLLDLPEDVEQPFILQFDPTLMPMMEVSLSGLGDLMKLTREVEEEIIPAIETIAGVASVNMQGGVQEDVFINLSNQKLKEQEISFDMVANMIRASLQDIPAGIQDIDDKNIRIRFLEYASDVEDIENLIVGFDIDQEKLEKLIDDEIDVDLAGEFDGLERDLDALDIDDVPMKTIYLKDITQEIEIDEENHELRIVFDVEETDESTSDLFDILRENLDEIDGIEEDFELPENWDIEEEDFDLEELEQDVSPRFPRLGEERGEIIIPLSEENIEDLSVEDIENTELYETFDQDQWIKDLESEIESELHKTSQDIEEVIVDFAVSYTTSQMSAVQDDTIMFDYDEDESPLIPIKLKSVADVEIASHDADSISRLDGEPAVSLTIQRDGEANTVDVARSVRSEINQIASDYSQEDKELHFNYNLDQGEEIEHALMDLAWSLIGGAVLAMITLLLFLRNWRTTLIIGLSIPTAIIFTFSILYFTDITVNLMTLGGLALAAGLLVDNAIVVSENIYRHLEKGKDPQKASVDGTNEVTGAIIASTLTTLSVFLPIVFISGIASELFAEFSITVACALFASLLIALTVIPLLASMFLRLNPNLKAKKEEEKTPTYKKILKQSLGKRWGVIAGALIFLMSTFWILPNIGMDLFPVPQESSFRINISLPYESTISQTDDYVQDVEELIEEHDKKIDFYSSQVGAERMMGLQMGGSQNQGSIRVGMKDDYVEDIDYVIEELRESIEELDKEEAEVSFRRESLLDAADLDMKLELSIIGDSMEKVQEIAQDVVEQISHLDILTDVESLVEDERPEMHIQVDQEKALEKGITIAQIGLHMREAFEGEEVSRIEREEEILDVIVQYDKDDFTTTEDIEELYIYSETSGYIPLKDIATISMSTGPLSISRENQNTVGEVEAQYTDVDLNTATQEAMNEIDKLDIPEGYEVEPSGTFDMMSDAFEELELVLIIAAILIYLVMAAQFESLLYPFIIICSLPLAFTGSLLALLLTGTTLSIPAMIGIVVLAGIFVNDSIIMIDFINQQRRIHKMPLKQAIIYGASARLRPILMITMTTILGVTPLAFGIGEGAELQAPMAIAIIGGQITGTLLLFVVIPTVYFTLSKKTQTNKKAF